MSKHEHLKCNLEKSIFKRRKGFTLVELIVVITILAILGTISFIAYQNYTKSARDGTRIADINMIKQNLGIFITEKSFYPNPDNGTMIKYDGALVRTQGTVGDTVTINLGRMSKKPVDPLTESEYTYSVANNRVEYQIGAISEEGAMAYITNPLTNNVYADTLKKATAMVTGTYNEKFLKVNTGGTNYILALPSIISADITDTNVTSIVANNKMVFNNYSNLPDSYKNNGYDMTGGFDFNPGNIVVFSGSTDYLDSESSKLALANNLENIYKDTIIKTEGIYQEIFSVANDTDKVFLINNYIANNIGGITGQVSAVVYHNCTTSNGETILHGETRDVFSENTILWDATYECADKSQSRTCNDGTLSGEESYKYLICSRGPGDNCLASGSYVFNEHTYDIPTINHTESATNITSSIINIDNGSMTYNLDSIQCIDGNYANINENTTPNIICNNGFIQIGNSCLEVINGICGSSNGLNASEEPTTGLCNSGSASAVTGTGPWSWTCEGINGGTTASCSTTNYCQVGGVGIGCIIQ